MKGKLKAYCKDLDEDQKNVLKSCAIVLTITAIIGITFLNFLGAFFALLVSRLTIPSLFASKNKAIFKNDKIVCEKRNKAFSLRTQKIYFAVSIICNIGFLILSPAILVLANLEGDMYEEAVLFGALLLGFICTNLYLLINKIPLTVMFTETSCFKVNDDSVFQEDSLSNDQSPNSIYYGMFK